MGLQGDPGPPGENGKDGKNGKDGRDGTGTRKAPPSAYPQFPSVGARDTSCVAGIRERVMRLKDPQLLREAAYIDGAWCGADSGATFEVTNPATGAVLARILVAKPQLIALVVTALVLVAVITQLVKWRR